MKYLSILGSTGSIGTSALDIVRMHPYLFGIKALACANNISLLARQIREFKPELVCVIDENKALELSRILKGEFKPEIVYGENGFIQTASYNKSNIVLLAMVGAAGLKPALAAIEAKKHIALANKETLVMAGEIVMAKAKENQVSILPVDSEHSAIFQCLKGNLKKDLKTIFLTASGGPFRKKSFKSFKDISLKDALKHPTWNMGHKITIDSATMMNKGLEIIEAVHFFDVSYEKIQVLIHPQSIVHSMVGYKDGSIIAQMGQPDMKAAISYALSEPDRLDLQTDFPSFTDINSLTFEKPDTKKFPSLLFAFEACRQKGTMPAVMNAANEIAVEAFLEKHINFMDIFKLISKAMEDHTCIDNPDLSSIIEADLWARDKVRQAVM
ncbi:MAG: 1-deoxy-D-xylulose-5-phosphate reductoisomerase [Deltaproteobacteria bacterium]|jgi:1-deoxy-D-xylulose-5-phosphate reductoisomerase|nr:1-deoxy-D-xylulose-5-phosphate reductoisomerase [Deltaproteobacteria bacterium]